MTSWPRMVRSGRFVALFLSLCIVSAAQHDHGDHDDHGDDQDQGGGCDLTMPTALVRVSGDTVRITLEGPDANWFGVAFGATLMQDEPYAIVVDGTHAVEEVTLSDHAVTNRHGSSGLTVVSSQSQGGIYTTTIERPLTGGHAGTVFTDSSEIQIMLAAGTSESLQYHGACRAVVLMTMSTMQSSGGGGDDHDDHAGHGHGPGEHNDADASDSGAASVGIRRCIAFAMVLSLGHSLKRVVV